MIPRSESSKCLIFYSNDDLLQDALSIDFEILHATLFESQSESICWRPILGIAISEGVLFASEHTGHTARLLLEPVCLCIVGSIAPHRLPTQLSFVYQLAAPKSFAGESTSVKVQSREQTVREYCERPHNVTAQQESTA